MRGGQDMAAPTPELLALLDRANEAHIEMDRLISEEVELVTRTLSCTPTEYGVLRARLLALRPSIAAAQESFGNAWKAVMDAIEMPPAEAEGG